MKKAYIVVKDDDTFLKIAKADIANIEGVSWRDAKKIARKMLLDAARALRSLREKDVN